MDRTDRRRRTAAAAILTVALLPGAVADATAAATAADAATADAVVLPDAMPGDLLLVSHAAPDGRGLHVVDPDSDGRTTLTAGEADTAGAWSPDGRHVAFHRVEVGGAGGLYVVPAAGGTARRLADGGHTPSWSPDGTRIVHSPSTEATPLPLRVTALDGTSVSVPGTEGGIDPAWSPDGQQVAYVDPARGHALVITRLDGADRTVTPGPAAFPTWSPAGDRVAHVEPRAGRSRLLVTDGAGSATVLLTDRFSRVQQLAWSPSGTHLAFAATDAADGDLDVWTVRVADRHLQQRAAEPADELRPTWAASGQRLAYTRTPDLSAGDSPRDVHVLELATATARQVTTTGADVGVAFAPGRSLRLSGPDRVATAIALSRTFPAAEEVVVASAERYPDALAGAPLAAALGAPVLLSPRAALPAAVRAELDRLGARRVRLLGGEAALSAQVAADLEAAGLAVRRTAGDDRFATAAAVAEDLRALVGEPSQVLVVEGAHADPARGWPDAVSASALAAQLRQPVLLVRRDELPGATASALRARSGADALVVGGTAAVSDSVAAQVDDLVADVARAAGVDRYGTSAAVAARAVAAGADPGHPWIGTGRDWPDALVMGPAAARDGGVAVLVDGRDPAGAAPVRHWVAGQPVRRAVVVGGASAVSPSVRAALEQALAGQRSAP